jgi:hypothetical protein
MKMGSETIFFFSGSELEKIEDVTLIYSIVDEIYDNFKFSSTPGRMCLAGLNLSKIVYLFTFHELRAN